MESKIERLGVPPSDFEDMIMALNQTLFSNFFCWVFYKGMLFLGTEKWWKEGEMRTSPHEGLDICYFRDKKGNLMSVDENTIIPAPYDGIVLSMREDFIGTSLFVKLDLRSDYPFLWALGHMNIRAGIEIGMKIKKGFPLGTVGPVRKRTSGLRSHLHISVGFLKNIENLEIIDWPKLNDTSYIQLLDPLPLLLKSFEIIE